MYTRRQINCTPWTKNSRSRCCLRNDATFCLRTKSIRTLGRRGREARRTLPSPSSLTPVKFDSNNFSRCKNTSRRPSSRISADSLEALRLRFYERSHREITRCEYSGMKRNGAWSLVERDREDRKDGKEGGRERDCDRSRPPFGESRGSETGTRTCRPRGVPLSRAYVRDAHAPTLDGIRNQS